MLYVLRFVQCEIFKNGRHLLLILIMKSLLITNVINDFMYNLIRYRRFTQRVCLMRNVYQNKFSSKTLYLLAFDIIIIVTNNISYAVYIIMYTVYPYKLFVF